MRVTASQIWRCRSIEGCTSSQLLSIRFQNLLSLWSENSSSQTPRKEWPGKSFSNTRSDSQSRTTATKILSSKATNKRWRSKKLQQKRKNILSKESPRGPTRSITSNKDFSNRDQSPRRILLMKSSRSILIKCKMIYNNNTLTSSTTPTWTPFNACIPKTTTTNKTTSNRWDSSVNTPCKIK